LENPPDGDSIRGLREFAQKYKSLL